MSRRRIAGGLGAVLGIAALAGCTGSAPAGADPTTASATAATSDAGAVRALAKLNTWFNRVGTADVSISTVQASRPANPIVTMVQLSGTTDVATSAAQLIGGRQQTSGNSNTAVDAVSSGGEFYSTVPPQKGVAGQPPNSDVFWSRTALSTIQGVGSRHSVWWLALHSLTKVHLDGSSTVGKSGATEYTGSVDLSKVSGIPASVLQQPFFKDTGSTVLSVDLYTDMNTGALVQLTYRMGLKVSIDAEPTAHSGSGFQVDLNNFGSPTPLVTQIAVPAEKFIISDGDDDLCLLLFF